MTAASGNSNLRNLPCGISSFKEIRKKNAAFADKTRIIETIDKFDIKCSFVVRPRRFGKTLVTTMLTSYYDEAESENFDEVFNGTYIYEHRTAYQGAFRVVNFDFSGVSCTENEEQAFCAKLLEGIRDYSVRYPYSELNKLLDNPPSGASAILDQFIVDPGGHCPLFIIIDEYDQLAREMLSQDVDDSARMTSSFDFVKGFYASLKSAANQGGLRIFITGVMPISLDTMTYGFNIATDLTTTPLLADAFGFTETELRSLIVDTTDLSAAGMDADAVVEKMREYCGGYIFTPPSQTMVFNPSMCLYFLRHLHIHGKEPDNLFDPSSNLCFGPDFSELESILRLGKKETADEIATSIAEGRVIDFPMEISRCFRIKAMHELSTKDVLSMLYYSGYLTFNPHNRLQLVCPNRVIHDLFIRCRC